MQDLSNGLKFAQFRVTGEMLWPKYEKFLEYSVFFQIGYILGKIKPYGAMYKTVWLCIKLHTLIIWFIKQMGFFKKYVFFKK